MDGDPARQFDFWLGTWLVHERSGELVGVNTITSEAGGAAVLERWRSSRGNEGTSLNYYDPITRRWKQVWAGLGILLTMEGGPKATGMVLEGPLQYLSDQRETWLRGTWSVLGDGRLRHLFEESADGNEPWEEWFDGYYSRKDDDG